MPDDLVVHLNRDGPHSIGVEPRRFVASGSFDVVLRNHGTALHVHLHLDDDLSPHARLGAANHYVDGGAVRRVRVAVADGFDPAEGRLKLVTGYGAETEYARITLADTTAPDRQVRVDDALGTPPTDAPEPLIDAGSLPVIALGGVALLVALVGAVLLDGPAAVVGLLIVVVGLAVAAALLWS